MRYQGASCVMRLAAVGYVRPTVTRITRVSPERPRYVVRVNAAESPDTSRRPVSKEDQHHDDTDSTTPSGDREDARSSTHYRDPHPGPWTPLRRVPRHRARCRT